MQEFYGVIASYNMNYVLEPPRKMRMRRWFPADNVSHLRPDAVPWIESLPVNNRENAGRQIEDFRERWAGFLDDMKQWLEKTNESFGKNLPTYFGVPKNSSFEEFNPPLERHAKSLHAPFHDPRQTYPCRI
jgi:hypothetical protein